MGVKLIVTVGIEIITFCTSISVIIGTKIIITFCSEIIVIVIVKISIITCTKVSVTI